MLSVPFRLSGIITVAVRGQIASFKRAHLRLGGNVIQWTYARFSQRRQQLFFSRRLIAADFQWCWPEYVHIQCFSPPSPRFPRCSLAGKRKWRTRDSPTKMQFSKRNGFGSSIMHEAGFSFLSELWHYFPVEFLSPPWPLPSSGHSRADSVRRVE